MPKGYDRKSTGSKQPKQTPKQAAQKQTPKQTPKQPPKHSPRQKSSPFRQDPVRQSKTESGVSSTDNVSKFKLEKDSTSNNDQQQVLNLENSPLVSSKKHSPLGQSANRNGAPQSQENMEYTDQ